MFVLVFFVEYSLVLSCTSYAWIFSSPLVLNWENILFHGNSVVFAKQIFAPFLPSFPASFYHCNFPNKLFCAWIRYTLGEHPPKDIWQPGSPFTNISELPSLIIMNTLKIIVFFQETKSHKCSIYYQQLSSLTIVEVWLGFTKNVICLNFPFALNN